MHRQQCLEEYKAEIENNLESFMQAWVSAYEDKTTSTISYDIYYNIFVVYLDVNICNM